MESCLVVWALVYMLFRTDWVYGGGFPSLVVAVYSMISLSRIRLAISEFVVSMQ